MTNQALLLRRMGCLERGTTTRSMANETSIVAAGIPVKIIIWNRRNFFPGRDKEEDKKNSTNEDNEGYGFLHASLLPERCVWWDYDVHGGVSIPRSLSIIADKKEKNRTGNPFFIIFSRPCDFFGSINLLYFVYSSVLSLPSTSLLIAIDFSIFIVRIVRSLHEAV